MHNKKTKPNIIKTLIQSNEQLRTPQLLYMGAASPKPG